MTQVYGSELHDLPPDDLIFGKSAPMAMARAKVHLAATTNVPVLLQGEGGTGKGDDLANPVSLKRITKAATARLEREIIHKVLAAHRGSRRKTAQWLNKLSIVAL